jgi:hypothetical protein
MPRWATALNFVIPTGADPDFLNPVPPEATYAAFRKPHEVRQCHQAGKEIRGSVGDLQFHSDRTQMPRRSSQVRPRNIRIALRQTSIVNRVDFARKFGCHTDSEGLSENSRGESENPVLYFPWADVAKEKWHIGSHYPTQAKERLEWGTQHLLPCAKKLIPRVST